MDWKLDFNPEEVADKLSEAIMSSTFKTMFEQAAQTEIAKLTGAAPGSYGIQTMISKIVENYIKGRIEDVLRTEYKDKIDAGIRAHFEKEDIFASLTDKLIDKLDLRQY